MGTDPLWRVRDSRSKRPRIEAPLHAPVSPSERVLSPPRTREAGTCPCALCHNTIGTHRRSQARAGLAKSNAIRDVHRSSVIRTPSV